MIESAVPTTAFPNGTQKPDLPMLRGAQVSSNPVFLRKHDIQLWLRATISATASVAVMWAAGMVLVLAIILLFWTALAALALGIWWRRRSRFQLGSLAASPQFAEHSTRLDAAMTASAAPAG